MQKPFISAQFKIIFFGILAVTLLITVSVIFSDRISPNSLIGKENNEGIGGVEEIREGQDGSSIETTAEGEAITLNPDFEVKVPSRYMGRDFDPFEYAKQNGDTDSISPRSTAAIVRDVHHMTHGAIVAKDKWGYLTLNDENIFILLTELAAVDRRNHVERGMIDMLSNWYHGDVSTIDEDHNFLWDWQQGTIGEAKGMDWEDVEEEIVERAIQNGYK